MRRNRLAPLPSTHRPDARLARSLWQALILCVLSAPFAPVGALLPAAWWLAMPAIALLVAYRQTLLSTWRGLLVRPPRRQQRSFRVSASRRRSPVRRAWPQQAA